MVCDVSTGFLDVLATRLPGPVESGALIPKLIDSADPHALESACEERDWVGLVDAVFAMDVFVHLDFNLVVGYMLSATKVLKPGGKLIFTFAEGTTEGSFAKMISEVDETIRHDAHPSTLSFRWVTVDLVRQTALRLGYEAELCDIDPHHRRDGRLVARLSDMERAKTIRRLR